MRINDHDNIVTLHRDVYESLLGRLEDLDPDNPLCKKVRRHARKFNNTLFDERQKEVLAETQMNKFLNRKLALLRLYHLRSLKEGKRLVVWIREYDNKFVPRVFVGSEPTLNNTGPRKRRVIVSYQLHFATNVLSVKDTVELKNVYVKWSDDLDSYTSDIIQANISQGIVSVGNDLEEVFSDLVEGPFKVNKALGLIKFDKPTENNLHSCQSL